jgi:hypothetical protein
MCDFGREHPLEAIAILASANTARRIIDEGVRYRLALGGISAAEVARAK